MHYNLARALTGIGKPDEAMAQLRIALSLDPDYRAASGLLFRLQLRRYAWFIGAGLVPVLVAAWLDVRRIRRNGARG